jgi:PIN like domain
MKETFKDFYKKDKSFYRDLWERCIFVFDTNVLLNLYRYTDNTREELLSILKDISDRIWMPHQVGLEYHFNRLNVIQEQIHSYSKIANIIEDKSKSFLNEINEKLKDYKKRHPKINISKMIEELDQNFKNIISEIKNLEKDHPNYYENDEILNELDKLFKNKVGEPYTKDKLNEIYRDGEHRYKFKIPPGFKDLEEKKKKGKKYFDGLIFSDEFGDLVIWNQMIDKSIKEKKPIVFITDDEKEDWWQIIGNRITVGPRYELINEFRTRTGQDFYMYKTYRFMEFAKKYLNKEIPSEAISEVKDFGGDTSAPRRTMTHPSWKYLNDSEIAIFNKMVLDAESEANPAVANSKYARALQWANSLNESRKIQDLYSRIISNLSPYLANLTPVDRERVFAYLYRTFDVNDESEIDDVTARMIEYIESNILFDY